MLNKIMQMSLLSVLIFSCSIFGENKRNFNKESWANNAEHRYEMLDDLCENYIYIGMSRKEVLDLLGEPDANSTCYVIKQGWGDPYVFEVHYDEYNKLLRYEDYSG